ncbi:ImmA/IrrE family metallo-endopeptidase [Globicatella sulfidifaciens]
MIEEQLDKIYKLNESYDPYMIAKRNDIDILNYPMDENTFGLTVRNNRCSTILLNDYIHENLKEFVLCHELGHSFMHKYVSTPFMRSTGAPSRILKIESEAHKFAFALLKRNYEELDYMTKEQIINYFQLPSWMERYINE